MQSLGFCEFRRNIQLSNGDRLRYDFPLEFLRGAFSLVSRQPYFIFDLCLGMRKDERHWAIQLECLRRVVQNIIRKEQ